MSPASSDWPTRRKLTASAAIAVVVGAIQALGGLLVVSDPIALLLYDGSVGSLAIAATLLGVVSAPPVAAQAAGALVIGASWRLDDPRSGRIRRVVRVFWCTAAGAMAVGVVLVPPIGLLWLAPLLLSWQPSDTADD